VSVIPAKDNHRHFLERVWHCKARLMRILIQFLFTAVKRAAYNFIEGHGFILNPANKTAVIEIMTKKLGITDPMAANDGYEDYVRRTDRKAFVIVDGLRNIQRFMKLRNPKIGEMNLVDWLMRALSASLKKTDFWTRL
jgi:hypothetical protein